jgi:hypothetical protein
VRYRYPAFVGVGIAASVGAALLGFAQKLPCSSGGAWNTATGQFRHACYTDIYPLYYSEQLSDGKVPYYGHPVEYPVLMGWMMEAGAWLVHSVADAYTRGRDFYYVTVLMLAVCLVIGVLATATAYRERSATQGNRPPIDQGWKAALLVALSPALILAALHQLGPVRDGAQRLRPGRLGGPPPVAGRRAARPGGGDQVLPAVLLRRAVPAVPAGGQAARVRQGAGRRADRLAGDQPAGRADGDVRLGGVLRVQPGPRGRLGLGLVPVRALQRAGGSAIPRSAS